MRKNTARAVATPTPPPVVVPQPIVRPTSQDLLLKAVRFTREAGPPGSDRDIERTARLVADKLNDCWDFWSEAG